MKIVCFKKIDGNEIFVSTNIIKRVERYSDSETIIYFRSKEYEDNCIIEGDLSVIIPQINDTFDKAVSNGLPEVVRAYESYRFKYWKAFLEGLIIGLLALVFTLLIL